MMSWRQVADQAIDHYGAQQSRGELAALLAIASAQCPDAVIEIGTAQGGMTWALAQLPGVLRVVTVDPVPTPQAAALEAASFGRIRRVIGDSADPATVSAVHRRLPDHPRGVLVLIDGNHTAEACEADWRAYEPPCQEGDLLVFHDISWRTVPQIQVHEVWAKVRARHPSSVTEIIDQPGAYGTGVLWL